MNFNAYNKPQLCKLKDIFKIDDLLSEKDVEHLIQHSNFDTSKRRSAWINLSTVPNITKNIENALNIEKDYFENMNIIEYTPNKIHSNHFTAYDLNTPHGKKYTEIRGQRRYTISIPLTDNININFPKIKLNLSSIKKGTCIIYDNCQYLHIRDKDFERNIINTSDSVGYLLNIYVREKKVNVSPPDTEKKDSIQFNLEKESTPVEKSEPASGTDISDASIENLYAKVDLTVDPKTNTKTEHTVDPNEDYLNTLNDVLSLFMNKQVTSSHRNFKSFSYNFKGDFSYFSECVRQYGFLKLKFNDKSCIKQIHLINDYTLDDILPIQVVENVLEEPILALFKEYYTKTIQDGVWPLGDRQANRYKAHNEPFSRILHYELLPLIEKITSKKLRPTYTYLSAYKKGTTLPPHTDRADCEYTVSFVVDKPDDSNWNIYVHKPRQPVKHKGRYDVQPPINECESVDCDAGGLMLFQGTDHIHFREELKHDYYNILLLHYCSV